MLGNDRGTSNSMTAVTEQCHCKYTGILIENVPTESTLGMGGIERAFLGMFNGEE